VRVLTHGAVQELDPTAVAFQLLYKQNLMDVVAGQPVGSGDQHHLQVGQPGVVPQPVQPGAAEAGPAEAVIAIHVLLVQRPSPVGHGGPQPAQLLVDGLGLGLTGRRDPGIQGDAHLTPPGWVVPADLGRSSARSPSAAALGRPGPTAGGHRGGDWSVGTRSIAASCCSPGWTSTVRRADGRRLRGRRHQLKLRWTRRVQQNLSFVIRPSSRASPKARARWGSTITKCGPGGGGIII
jgi:hypothetical protein